MITAEREQIAMPLRAFTVLSYLGLVRHWLYSPLGSIITKSGIPARVCQALHHGAFAAGRKHLLELGALKLIGAYL